MTYVVEWHGSNIHWHFIEVVSTDAVLAAYGEFYGHEQFDAARGQLRDFSAISGGVPEVEDVQKIAAVDRAAAHSNPHMKVALVTPDNLDFKMLAALYCAELYDSPWEAEMFDCPEEAKLWLAA